MKKTVKPSTKTVKQTKNPEHLPFFCCSVEISNANFTVIKHKTAIAS